jgi:ABC-type transport system involved in multi-copper enzyme maturation permease subunit
MKFLAILRDSLREAIDIKVFYVMVGLSGLLILFAFGIGFTPRAAADSLRWIGNASLNARLGKQLGEADPEVLDLATAFIHFSRATMCDVTEVEALDPEAPPWESRYRFVLKRIDAGAGPLAAWLQGNIEQRLREEFGRLGSMQMVTVEEVSRLPGGGERYRLTVRPTSATRRVWVHDASVLYGLIPVKSNSPIGLQMYFIESGLVLGMGGLVTMLVAIIITAFFIPNMLRKGTIEPLLVKPLPRWRLLVYKYIGGLTFVFLNAAIAVGGVWLALSLKSGVWAPGFLLTIFSLTFAFAILYAASTLFGVLSQSPVAALMITLGVWFGLWIVGFVYQFQEMGRTREERSARKENREPEAEGTFPKVVRAVHFVLPRTSDLGVLNAELISRELMTANQMAGLEVQPVRVNWVESLSVSFAFIVVCLGIASWRLSRRDI